MIQFENDENLLLYDHIGSEYDESSNKRLAQFIKDIKGFYLQNRTRNLTLFDEINGGYYNGEWRITKYKTGGKRTKYKKSKGKRKRSKTRSRK